MKKRSGLLSAVSILLVIALVAGIGGSLIASGRTRPDNPIDAQPEQLRAESLQGSGNTGGQGSGKGNAQSAESAEGTENTDPTQEPTEPPTEPERQDQTEPPTEPTRGEEDTDPTAPTDKLVENPDDNQGGNKPDDTKGGPEDSGDHGDGTGGDDGDDGGTGGDHGSGGEEDDTPRIYTTLKTQQLTKSELPDGKLAFIAYPIGKGDLHIRVRLKNETNSGNGLLLTSQNNKDYEALLDFNAENLFVLSLYDGDTFLGLVQYRVGYYADLADDDNPESGDYPPSIVTNLDGASLDMTSQTFPLTVIARANAKLGAGVIYSNQIQVTLDGKIVEKSYGDSQPVYELNFEAPQIGDEESHIVRVLAWDGNGNSAMKVYTVTYHQISEGDPAGSVNVVLDATTIGLGILDSGTLDIVEGETAASVVLRFLQERGYEPDYQGTATMNFYLRRINRGDIAYRANVPEHLWELILRDGITTNGNYDRDSIGEFDYTQGSGWMYSINGTLYEGTGMSGYKVRNGITIYLRFTLSYGKDIGGYDATGGGYGALSSYCGLWINGGYQALDHDFEEAERVEPTETEDGYILYRCTRCHEEETDVLPATGGETEPTQPDPTDPDPTEPTPTDPTEPTPTDPTQPEPTEPTPTDPSEPTPTEPSEPEPTDPVDPEPAEQASTQAMGRQVRRRMRSTLAGYWTDKIVYCQGLIRRFLEAAA